MITAQEAIKIMEDNKTKIEEMIDEILTELSKGVVEKSTEGKCTLKVDVHFDYADEVIEKIIENGYSIRFARDKMQHKEFVISWDNRKPKTINKTRKTKLMETKTW